MRLSGTKEIGVTPERMREALQSAEILAMLLPGTVEMQPAGPGNYRFTFRKAMGPLEFRQSGSVEVRILDGDRIGLAVRSGHRFGGKVEMATVIALTDRPGGTEIGYDGKVEATGLAARLLRDREERLLPYIERAMVRLKAKIEDRFAA